MKKTSLGFAIGLVLCAADIPHVIAGNLWIYEQKFNDLNSAALSGQDSWTGTAGFDVVTTSPYEGARCVKQPSGANYSDNTRRSVGSIASGTLYFSHKSTNYSGSSGSGAFILRNNIPAADIDIFFWSDGNIKSWSPDSGTWVNIGTYTDGTWVRVGIAFEYGAGAWEGLSQRHFKVNVNNGPWSSEIAMRNANGTSISDIWFYRFGGDTDYFDYISPNYEPSTPTPTETPTPTNTPTLTPTVTPTPTPTVTPTATPTNTPDSVPPDAPVINHFGYDGQGRIGEICGTASGDTATVEVFDEALSLGTAGPTPPPNPAWCVTLSTPLAAGPHSIHALAKDASGQNDGSTSRDYRMTQTMAVNVHEETDPLLTHSPGTSLRLDQDGSCEFKSAVNASAQVTVQAWLRKNSDYSGTAPKLTLTGPGINGTGAATASMTAGPDTWQEIVVSGTPAAKGLLTLKVETFSTADGASAWIDDISVSQ